MSASDSASDAAVLASNKMLTAREGFSDWKSKMQMHALAKCDGHARIFFNAGATPAERAEYTGLSATYRRKWDVASTTIFGEIGMHIQDRTLLRLWTETYSTVMTGNAIMRPFVVGICMIAMESECLRDSDTAKNDCR